MKRPSVSAVEAATRPGRFCDGDGLHLFAWPGGAKAGWAGCGRIPGPDTHRKAPPLMRCPFSSVCANFEIILRAPLASASARQGRSPARATRPSTERPRLELRNAASMPWLLSNRSEPGSDTHDKADAACALACGAGKACRAPQFAGPFDPDIGSELPNDLVAKAKAELHVR